MTTTTTKISAPLVLTDQSSMRRWSRTVRHRQGLTLALIPTMGYLHQGHISLIEEARNHADAIVVSIYVNPGQFAPSEDLSTYPKDFLGDLEKLQALGCVDAVFRPRDLYDYSDAGGHSSGRDRGEGAARSCVEERDGGHETWVRVERLEKGLCGKSRPVFFRGVVTIVCKLFNVVEPDVAVFGKKDYQQWRIIQRMVGFVAFYRNIDQKEIKATLRALVLVEPASSFSFLQVRDLDFGIRIIGSEIVREDDGLAMSSRNVNLSLEERQKALSISKSLSIAKHAAENGERDCRKLKDSVVGAIEEAGGRIDYAEIVKQDTLEAATEINRPVVFCVAACFGKVRLIDNMEID